MTCLHQTHCVPSVIMRGHFKCLNSPWLSLNETLVGFIVGDVSQPLHVTKLSTCRKIWFNWPIVSKSASLNSSIPNFVKCKGRSITQKSKERSSYTVTCFHTDIPVWYPCLGTTMVKYFIKDKSLIFVSYWHQGIGISIPSFHFNFSKISQIALSSEMSGGMNCSSIFSLFICNAEVYSWK